MVKEHNGDEPELEERRHQGSADEVPVDEASQGGGVPGEVGAAGEGEVRDRDRPESPEARTVVQDDAAPEQDTGDRAAPGAAPGPAAPASAAPPEDADDTVELPSPARPRRTGAAAGAAAAGAGAAESGFGGPSAGGEISFGTWLRRQREMREIDLREIADKTKISLRYLKAMEQDRFELLPAPVFARGFLREYSKYVGLNADEVVNYYLSTQHGQSLEEEASEELVDPGSSRGPVTRGAFLALLLIVAVALLAYFLFYRQSQEDARRAAPPPIAPPATETVPTEVPPPPEEEVLSAPLVVTLDFTQECWVEARVDGAPQVSRLFVAGESIQLEGEESVELSLGNGGGVEVQVNNMPLDLDADEGEIVSVTIDPATVQRLRQRG